MSSLYSGIGTVEQALHQICHNLSLAPGCGHHSVQSTWAPEKDEVCKAELVSYVHEFGGNTCVFGNLNDFGVPFRRPVVRRLEKTPGKVWAVLKPSVLAGRAITAEAGCLRHGRMCKIVEAHVHIAGTCCQDHSDFGSQRGLQGKGAAALLAWIGLRLLLQEPEIIQENVKSFPPVILLLLLGCGPSGVWS